MRCAVFRAGSKSTVLYRYGICAMQGRPDALQQSYRC